MPRNGSQAPRVFISYSWDSEEHENNVLDLADRLRVHGIDCHLDRFEVSLAEGNQGWLCQQIEDSDFVIVICTEEYKKSFQGKGKSTGENETTWNGFVLNQVIYDRLSNNKFIPVIFSSEDSKHIPTEFRKYTYYSLDSDSLSLENQEYRSLHQHLSDRLGQRESFETVKSLPSLTHYEVGPPIQDKVVQQEQLAESYQRIRKLSRTRSWNEIISTFQKIQDDNLPYFDPNGYYKLACKEVVKQEQQTRIVHNIYSQGTRHYQDGNWRKAQEKLKKVLQSPTTNRALAIKTEEKLDNIQKKLDKEKKISIIVIILGWLVSVFLPINIRVIGGFTSGAVIWYLSHQKRALQPSQEILKLFSFIAIGIIIEISLLTITKSILNFRDVDFVINTISLIIGITISLKVMNWHTDR